MSYAILGMCLYFKKFSVYQTEIRLSVLRSIWRSYPSTPTYKGLRAELDSILHTDM